MFRSKRKLDSKLGNIKLAFGGHPGIEDTDQQYLLEDWLVAEVLQQWDEKVFGPKEDATIWEFTLEREFWGTGRWTARLEFDCRTVEVRVTVIDGEIPEYTIVR